MGNLLCNDASFPDQIAHLRTRPCAGLAWSTNGAKLLISNTEETLLHVWLSDEPQNTSVVDVGLKEVTVMVWHPTEELVLFHSPVNDHTILVY